MTELADAIASEALTAGRDIDYDVPKSPETLHRKSPRAGGDEAVLLGGLKLPRRK